MCFLVGGRHYFFVICNPLPCNYCRNLRYQINGSVKWWYPYRHRQDQSQILKVRMILAWSMSIGLAVSDGFSVSVTRRGE